MTIQWWIAAVLVLHVAAGTLTTETLTATELYPEWAHHHLVWKSSGHNQAVITAMLKNYSANRIAVGALNVDSGWSTGYNNFIFDTALFPNPKELIDLVHNHSQRIVLWVTSMVNTDSSNYHEAVAKDYVLNLTMSWWHGQGRLVDFSNAAAVQWWESQIEQHLFDRYGCIDGWKCDGTDPWIIEYEVLNPHSGWTWPKYAADYYGFFFNYTRKRCGAASLIMSRPCDCLPPGGIDHTGICPLHVPFAPRSVTFMGWVGDQDSTFLGLGVAYGNMMASASANFVSFGSDTGGYRGNGPSHVAKDLFLRWAALNAMMPVFENGGDNRHCPWEFDDETVEIYRDLVDFHHTLVPYLYSNGLKLAEAPNGSLVTPVETGGHLLGPQYFAYPVLTENATEIAFVLPEAGSGGWYAFNSTTHYNSSALVLIDVTALSSRPFFVRGGSISVLYDVEGHREMLFPQKKFPILVHTYATDVDSAEYSSTDGSFFGLREVAVNVWSGRVESVRLRWAEGAERRPVRHCHLSPRDVRCAPVA
jgi:alpha-D-xyloside xylohydrolase/trinucleotide repeat-containing gene 6 protein